MGAAVSVGTASSVANESVALTVGTALTGAVVAGGASESQAASNAMRISPNPIALSHKPFRHVVMRDISATPYYSLTTQLMYIIQASCVSLCVQLSMSLDFSDDPVRTRTIIQNWLLCQGLEGGHWHFTTANSELFSDRQ